MRRVQRALYAATGARSARRGIRENCKTRTKDNYLMISVETMSMKRPILDCSSQDRTKKGFKKSFRAVIIIIA